jgi:acetoacetyl-CoA synthetase
MTTQSASATIAALTEIWERVLQRSPIGVDDNFFDLGGESLTAVTLFLEIEKFCGRRLPSVLIYNAPTISALATELERPATSRLAPLIQLRAGGAATPVFMAHGLGGSVIDFHSLLTFIKTDHPIYGMQARGIDGIEEPSQTIEAMAQYHLDAIREIQPHGPYILVGYSLGGLVCLEIAQRLIASGEKIALLAMIDGYPFRKYIPWFQRLRLSMRLAINKLAVAIGMAAARPDQRFLSPAQIRAQMSAGRRISAHTEPSPSELVTPAMERAADVAKEALKRYQPSYYPHSVRFVRAQVVTDFPANPAAVWSHLVQRFECETVPGDHLGMIASHPEVLAAVITKYLNEASGTKC